MANELAQREECAIQQTAGYEMLPVAQIKHQSEQVKELMANCMTDSLHYGKIPGCGDKPTLLQPGAQKLTLMFGLADTYEVQREDLPNGHREYTVTCQLVSKHTGVIQGSGMGLCTTMEKKYRYRNVADYEITDMPIPQDAKERKQEYRKQGFGMKKVNDQWCWVKYKDSAQQENPDIADTYNTVLKMAMKRALVSAVLNTLAVSDLFTQDIEDLGEYAIDYTRQPSQPQSTQSANTSKQDPRGALWNTAAQLKAQVLDMGANESGINSWMAANIKDAQGNPKDMKLYDANDIQALINHLQGQIKDLQTMQAQRQQQDEYAADADYYAANEYDEQAEIDASLADHDIPF